MGSGPFDFGFAIKSIEPDPIEISRVFVTTKRLSVRKFLGYGLLVVCAIAWVVVVVVPFLDVGLGRGAAIVTGLIIVGEGAFVIGVALLGKDILNSTKTLIGRLKRELRR